MDFLRLLLGNTSLSIIDEQSGISKWPRFEALSVDIMAGANSTDNPIAATPLQVVGVYSESVYSNMQGSKVLMPSNMSITGIVADVSTMDSIIAAFKDLESTYSITARSIISNGMSLVGIEINQNSDNISSANVTLNFDQTSESNLTEFNPLQSADKDTVGISTKQPITLTDRVSDLYNNITSKLGL